MFFTPVRVKNNCTEDHYGQCSSPEKDIQSKFVHLGSSSSIRYAITNAVIQNNQSANKYSNIKSPG